MSDPRFAATAGNLLAVLRSADAHAAALQALEQEHRLVRGVGLEGGAELLHRENPDLILLDADCCSDDDLPQALQRLHAENAPVVMLGAVPTVRCEAALACGADDCLDPTDPPALLARRINRLLDLRYAQELLRSQSLLDGLTGLANRRRFDEFLHAAHGNARRRQEPMALILFDVDEFASYNEQLGAQAGDEVLLHIGRTLASARRRPLDLFSRFSGDCFACILPTTDLDGARAVAELFLADVDALQIEHPESSVASHVTISVGIAAQVPSPESSPLALLDHAGQALRRAKRAGRHAVSD